MMKNGVLTLLSLFYVSVVTVVVFAATPIPHVQVTFRGTKYDLKDVTTVDELQERVSEASGVDPTKQGRVLFNGQRLSSNDNLSDVGVSDGSSLNIVPKSSSNKKSSTTKTPAAAAAAAAVTTDSSSGAGDAFSDVNNMMKDMLDKAGIDTNELNDLVNSMGGPGGLGGAGGAGGEPPSMKQSLEMMSQMMNSPMIQNYMSDPEKLEQSRQMILSNPMLKSMMGNMPGMEELLNDKDAWVEAMQAAANLYKNMDSDDLLSAMMGGAGAGAGGMPNGFDPNSMMGGGTGNGLFDTPSATAGSTTLDELSEGDD